MCEHPISLPTPRPAHVFAPSRVASDTALYRGLRGRGRGRGVASLTFPAHVPPPSPDACRPDCACAPDPPRADLSITSGTGWLISVSKQCSDSVRGMQRTPPPAPPPACHETSAERCHVSNAILLGTRYFVCVLLDVRFYFV